MKVNSNHQRLPFRERLMLTLLPLCMGLALLSGPPAQAAASLLAWDDVELSRTKDGFLTTIILHPSDSGRMTRTLRVTLLDNDYQVVTSTSKRIFMPKDAARKTERILLAAEIPQGKEDDYAVEVSYEGSSLLKRVFKYRGTWAVSVLGQKEWIAGSRVSLRLAVSNPSRQGAVHQADVRIDLCSPGGEKPLASWSGRTDLDGTAEIAFAVPAEPLEEAELRIAVEVAGTEREITQKVSIIPGNKILLTTDKPVYQPMQVIHIRALALHTTTLKPLADQPLTLEVEDSKGNKVFKEILTTSEFGVAGTTFQLADEINEGRYTVRAVMNEEQTEKKVRVERYVLPKFKCRITTGKPYYLPGDKIAGDVQADYFFGKPLKDAQVIVKASAFDVGFNEFDTTEVKTDETGHATFEIQLPEMLVGQLISKGNTEVALEVEVKDTADHKETKYHTVTVAKDPILVQILPESGSLVPGVKNEVFVLTSYPTGKPAQTDLQIRVHPTGKRFSVKTDEHGTGSFLFTPEDKKTTIEVTAKDTEGNETLAKSDFEAEDIARNLLLRTDKPVYKVGEAAQLEVVATGLGDETLFVDVIKNRQTMLTKTLRLEGGVGSLRLPLDASLFGNLRVSAYKILPSSEFVRDTKEIFVKKADDLDISVVADQDVYRPGGEAELIFRVKDKTGKGKPAALGLDVVDESVYGLAENQPGLLEIFFTLEKELLEPKVEVHGFDMPDIVRLPGTEEIPPEILRLGRAALAPYDEHPEYALQVDTGKEARDVVSGQIDYLLYLVALVGGPTAETELPAESVLFANRVLKSSQGTLDPWGMPYWVVPEGKAKWAVASSGPDGRLGTGDDIRRRYKKEEFQQRLHQALYTRHRGGRVEDLFVLESVGGVVDREAVGRAIDNYFIDSAFVAAGIPRAGAPERWARGERERLAMPLFDMKAPGMMGGTGIRFKAGAVPAEARLQALGYLGDQRQQPLVDGMLVFGLDVEATDPKENISVLGYYGDLVSKLDAYAVDESRAESTELALRMGDVGKPEQAEQPRVRSWFPETLLSEPAVITDENGIGRRRVAIADSITTWRLTGQANTLDGEVGSTTSALRVFQEFFVDIDLPVALTQGDEVTLPVAVYNYLKEDQEVRIVLQREAWFELLEGSYERTIEVPADSVDSSPYRILVKDIGPCSLTVYGYGASKSDAVMRTVQVKPNGKEILESTSDRLDRFVDETLVIPAEALDGASKILLKIYPGLFSQVLEGMDSILRMPSGCFEQTSSTTYPNLLVLDYMRHTNQINPEIEMRAKQYINLGYQRLFSYEVPGGGFQAFGNPPANRILTAYGLQQFFDMSKVHPVDPELIPRTQAWLARQQNADGSWMPDDNYVHAEMWQGIQNSNLVATAYIVEGLTSSGYRGEALDKAMGYLRKHAGEAKDAFSLVHLAAALVGIDPEDQLTLAVLKRLRDLAKETKDEAYWESGATFSFACGDVASIEVTAHAALAMMQAGKHPELTGKVLNWLLRKKDPSGTWNSTHATVLAMKIFLTALERQTETAEGKVLVKINGKQCAPIMITPETSDVLRMLDLGPSTVKGSNQIHIEMQGEGSLLYQLVAKYYLPWEEEEKLQEPLTIKVDYDRTELQKDDTVTCKVEVQNHQPMIANMVMVDVGIPPGFKVESEELEAYVAQRAIEKYNITGRQLSLYLEKLDPGRPARYEVKMKARFPLRAKTPESRVYQYYNPEILGMAEPIDMVVEG